jgi:hypothetical protein
MPVHSFQEFSGVSTPEEYLGNIRIVAEANGWTVDKDVIASSGELYLHSNGNGNQNLYFSFKIRSAIDDTSKKYLAWHCNTGFDSSKAWDDQPGRFSVIPKSGFLTDGACWHYVYGGSGYNGADFAHWIPNPCVKQFVFVSSQTIFVVQRVVHAMLNGETFAGYSSFVVGAMDSTKGDSETELNFTLASPWGHGGALGTMFNPWMILPDTSASRRYHRVTIQPFGLLYSGSGAINLPQESGDGYSGSPEKMFYTSIGRLSCKSAGRSFYWNTSPSPDRWERSGIGSGYDTYIVRDPQYAVDYSRLLIQNPGMAKTVLHQPIITVEDMSGETHYIYPTRACLPYYACAMHPYHAPESTVSLGDRTFMCFPSCNDNDDFGYAIEIS